MYVMFDVYHELTTGDSILRLHRTQIFLLTQIKPYYLGSTVIWQSRRSFSMITDQQRSDNDISVQTPVPMQVE